MSKTEKIIELFNTHDEDHDGQINATQFGTLVTDLGYDYIYPGTINKMIRKLNYLQPEKTTINLQQTKQYAESLSSASQHSIWKEKYSILEWTHEVKRDLNRQAEDKEAAAPGASPSKWKQDNSVHNAQVRVLVGQHKPFYPSQIKLQVEKNEGGPKVKPFIKLNLAYKVPDRAKKMETLFKQSFTKILKMVGEEDPEWAEQMNNFHINSFVQGNNVTFFITTVNAELVSLIQLFSQVFELIFDSQSNCRAFMKFQFDYDFNQFFADKTSCFYDIFVKNNRLHITGRAQHFIRQFKRVFMSDSNNNSCDLMEQIIPVALFHLEGLDADLEFDSYEGTTVYDEEQMRNQINEGLEELAGFFMQLQDGGIDIKGLLQLLDADITIQASVGEWQAKTFFRFQNLNNLILTAFTTYKEKGTLKAAQNSDSDSNSSGAKKPKKAAYLEMEDVEMTVPQPAKIPESPGKKSIKLSKKDSLGNSIYSDISSDEEV